MYVLPLVVVSFVLYASRGWPHLRAHALLAAVAATAAAVVPLSGYAAGGGTASRSSCPRSTSSGTVRRRRAGVAGVRRRGHRALGGRRRGRITGDRACGRPFAVGVTASRVLAVTGGAFPGSDGSRASLRDHLPPRRRGVGRRDGRGTGDAARRAALDARRSPQHALLEPLRSAAGPARRRRQARRVRRARTGGRRRGRLDLPAGALLTDMHGSTVLLRDAERVAAGPTKTLWRTAAPPQLQLVLAGRYFSGLLASDGGIRVWPAEPGGRLRPGSSSSSPGRHDSRAPPRSRFRTGARSR